MSLFIITTQDKNIGFHSFTVNYELVDLQNIYLNVLFTKKTLKERLPQSLE